MQIDSATLNFYSIGTLQQLPSLLGKETSKQTNEKNYSVLLSSSWCSYLLSSLILYDLPSQTLQPLFDLPL